MLNVDYTAKILDLKDVIVTNVEKNDIELHIYLELPRRKHSCPQCGYETDSVHDYREQLVKDLPLGRNTLLHLRKRRYRCEKCRKRFYEQNSFLPRYHRLTNRLAADIICSFSKLQSAKEIAKTHNVSNSTAIRYFDLVSHKCSALPRILSIDEFKGNAGGERYQSILTDPEKRQIVDVLPNRFEGDLIQYFRGFPSRKNVEYFITDMNPHFRNVAKVCFPSATIVADKYHVIRQAIWAMERVRKNEQKKLSDRFRKYFKRSRYLLNRPFHKLTLDEQNSLALMLEISPRLADAYRIKNEFLEVMKSNSSAVGKEKMVQWLNTLNIYDLPEYNDCEKAVRNWFAEIMNSLDVPWTNGYTEGCNNKTKVLKRISFGVRNFNRFRNRILFCS